jgi:hypothetical protein
MKQLGLLTMLAVIVITTLRPARAQTRAEISIALPIHGRLALITNNTLYLADTYTGDLDVLDTVESPLETTRPLIHPQTSAILFTRAGGISLLMPDSGDFPYQVLAPAEAETYRTVAAWNGDGKYALVRLDVPEQYQALDIVDVASGASPTLVSYQWGQPLDIDPAYAFQQFISPSWHPVADDWVIYIVASWRMDDSETLPDEEYFYFLHNIATGERTEFGSLVSDARPRNLGISPDGESLLINFQEYIDIFSIEFEENWPIIRPADIRIIIDRPHHTFGAGWSALDGFMLFRESSEAANAVIFSLAQFNHGRLYTQEVLRISAASFGTEWWSLSISNWVLTADEQERGALSCLFDQTVPARLEVGARARVTFTDGTPSRLRAEPGLDGTEIAQMAEGTEFSVIGGPWCADEYRWWQLELDDGMIGWSAEGDAEDYFLEPVE